MIFSPDVCHNSLLSVTLTSQPMERSTLSPPELSRHNSLLSVTVTSQPMTRSTLPLLELPRHNILLSVTVPSQPRTRSTLSLLEFSRHNILLSVTVTSQPMTRSTLSPVELSRDNSLLSVTVFNLFLMMKEDLPFPFNYCKRFVLLCFASVNTYTTVFNPFKPEFTIVIFIHYKPRIKENYHYRH